MPRPARPWFRFYVEALSDRKLRRLTPAQRWLWVAILGAARQSPIGGYLLISERESMDAVDLADIAGMPVRDVERALPLFERAGLIERDDDFGAWYVPKWNTRQYESDDTTKRTRKHRSKPPDGNDEGTFQPRSEERPNSDEGTPVGTPPETEGVTDNPPNPPPSGGHRGQHPNCRACGTNRRGPTQPPPDPLADQRESLLATAGHGLDHMQAIVHAPLPDDDEQARARELIAEARRAQRQPARGERARTQGATP